MNKFKRIIIITLTFVIFFLSMFAIPNQVFATDLGLSLLINSFVQTYTTMIGLNRPDIPDEVYSEMQRSILDALLGDHGANSMYYANSELFASKGMNSATWLKMSAVDRDLWLLENNILSDDYQFVFEKSGLDVIKDFVNSKVSSGEIPIDVGVYDQYFVTDGSLYCNYMSCGYVKGSQMVSEIYHRYALSLDDSISSLNGYSNYLVMYYADNNGAVNTTVLCFNSEYNKYTVRQSQSYGAYSIFGIDDAGHENLITYDKYMLSGSFNRPADVVKTELLSKGAKEFIPIRPSSYMKAHDTLTNFRAYNSVAASGTEIQDVPVNTAYGFDQIDKIKDGASVTVGDLKKFNEAAASTTDDTELKDLISSLIDTINATATTPDIDVPVDPELPEIDTSSILSAITSIYKLLLETLANLFHIPHILKAAESIDKYVQAMPNDLADAVSDVFPVLDWWNAFRDIVEGIPQTIVDGLGKVITDVFPAATWWDEVITTVEAGPVAIVDALVDIFPVTQPIVDIATRVKDLPADIASEVDRALEWLHDITVNIGDVILDVPILGDILKAIQAILAWLVIDTDAISQAIDAAISDTFSNDLDPLKPIIDLFRFSDNYTYPVIKIDTPKILLPYYGKPEIIFLDFADWKEQFLWVRTIIRACAWFGCVWWFIEQNKVQKHIA